SGYQMVLPWKVWPSTEKLRVVAQLRLPDGRTFESDKDVSIRLTPVARRKQLPADPTPAEEPVLPPPRTPDPAQSAIRPRTPPRARPNPPLLASPGARSHHPQPPRSCDPSRCRNRGLEK